MHSREGLPSSMVCFADKGHPRQKVCEGDCQGRPGMGVPQFVEDIWAIWCLRQLSVLSTWPSI